MSNIELTIEWRTDTDAFRGIWSDLTEAQLASVEAYFAGSSDWTRSPNPVDVRTAKLFAYIETRFQHPRLYLAKTVEAVDSAADVVDNLWLSGSGIMS